MKKPYSKIVIKDRVFVKDSSAGFVSGRPMFGKIKPGNLFLPGDANADCALDKENNDAGCDNCPCNYREDSYGLDAQ